MCQNMNTPAHKLKKSVVRNIVCFPAIKANGGKTVLVESILESKYCLHLEFDSDVEMYFPQSRKFKISDEDEENIYTPDFEVHYVCGARKLRKLPEYLAVVLRGSSINWYNRKS